VGAGQARVAVHQDGLEAALKEMSDQAVAPVEALRVDPVDLAHQARQVGPPRVQHQMEMVAHQAIGQHLRVETLHRVGDDRQLHGPVFVVAIDPLAAIAA
jgi:hypothetical protein